MSGATESSNADTVPLNRSVSPPVREIHLAEPTLKPDQPQEEGEKQGQAETGSREQQEDSVQDPPAIDEQTAASLASGNVRPTEALVAIEETSVSKGHPTPSLGEPPDTSHLGEKVLEVKRNKLDSEATKTEGDRGDGFKGAKDDNAADTNTFFDAFESQSGKEEIMDSNIFAGSRAVRSSPSNSAHYTQQQLHDQINQLLAKQSSLEKRLEEEKRLRQWADHVLDQRDDELALQPIFMIAPQCPTDGWWSGVTAARKANDEHMGEEEHEGLADFRRYVDLDTRHRIAIAFAAYEAANVTGVPIEDKDPDTYIRDNS